MTSRLAAAGVALSLTVAGTAGFGVAASAAGSSKAVVPVLTALKPSVGVAGQSISLIGTGFHSNNGVIFTTFGTRGTYTHCPTTHLCIALVPKGLSGSQMVRLHTQTGTSNALIFKYR